MRKIALVVALVAGVASAAHAGKPAAADKKSTRAGTVKPAAAVAGSANANPKNIKPPQPASKEIGTATGSCKGPPAKQVSCALHANPAGGEPCCYCEGKCKAPSQCMACPGSEMASGIANRLFD